MTFDEEPEDGDVECTHVENEALSDFTTLVFQVLFKSMLEMTRVTPIPTYEKLVSNCRSYTRVPTLMILYREVLEASNEPIDSANTAS